MYPSTTIRSLWLEAELTQEPPEHDRRVEVLAGDLACRLRVAFVGGAYLVDRCCRIIDRPKRQQPLPARQCVTEAGVLHDDRAPARQVGRAPIAEPTAPGRAEHVLAHAPLGPAVAEIVEEGVDRARDMLSIADQPAAVP